MGEQRTRSYDFLRYIAVNLLSSFRRLSERCLKLQESVPNSKSFAVNARTTIIIRIVIGFLLRASLKVRALCL